MKTRFDFFRKHKPHVVQGISAKEYRAVEDAIVAEYARAEKRQHPDTKEPSSYMKGLLYALNVVRACEPHELEVM